MFYSPVLQAKGRLVGLDNEWRFRRGKLYSAYVTVTVLVLPNLYCF